MTHRLTGIAEIGTAPVPVRRYLPDLDPCTRSNQAITIPSNGGVGYVTCQRSGQALDVITDQTATISGAGWGQLTPVMLGAIPSVCVNGVMVDVAAAWVGNSQA